MCKRRRQRRDVRASRIPPATDSLNPLSAVLASLIQRLRVPKCHARAILTVKPPSSRPDGSVRVDPGTGITTERTGDPMSGIDLVEALAWAVCFLGTVMGLLFFLAWLEQPSSERWVPVWWSRSRRAAGAAGQERTVKMTSPSRVQR